jgi:hypothetical protein
MSKPEPETFTQAQIHLLIADAFDNTFQRDEIKSASASIQQVIHNTNEQIKGLSQTETITEEELRKRTAKSLSFSLSVNED